MSAAAVDSTRREKINVPAPEHLEIAFDLGGPRFVGFLHLYLTRSPGGTCTGTVRYTRVQFATDRVAHLSDGELMSVVVHAVAEAMARDGYELGHFIPEKDSWSRLPFWGPKMTETTLIFHFRKT